jgi:hypothetical protein
MSITLSALQQQRRDTASNWTSANPTLLGGEWGYETDTGKWKVGDGSTAWTSLAYVAIPDNNGLIPIDQLLLPLGTAAAPSLTFTGDVDTGLYSPGADQVAISTNGTGRLFVDASGNVGVGQSSPAVYFDIFKSGATQADLRVRNGTSGLNLAIKTDGTADISNVLDYPITFTTGISPTEKLRITSDGKLLVGTSTSQAHASANLVEIGNYTLTNAGITINSPTSGAGLINFGDSASSNRRGRIEYTHAEDAFRFYTADNERLRITSDGKLGLGTISPGQKFVVKDTSAASTSTYINVISGNTGNAGIIFGDSDADSRAGVLYNNDDEALRFFKSGFSEAARIDSSGRLGLGTSAPANLLEIAGNNTAGNGIGNVQGILRVNNNTTAFGSSPTAGIVFATKYRTSPDIPLDGAAIYGGKENTSDANKSFFLAFATRAESGNNGNEAMRIDSQGRVGIGTNTAGAKLHVAGSGQQNVKIQDTGNTYGLDLGNNTTESFISTADNKPITFYTNNLERAKLDSSGRLLVGTSAAPNLNTAAAPRYPKAVIFSDPTSAAERHTLSLYSGSTSTDGPLLTFTKNKATSTTSTLVANGDQAGQIAFAACDGAGVVNAASITCQVDGTPGANDMPGRLVFSTTADGASSPTERMRIKSNGFVGIGVDPAIPFHVKSGVYDATAYFDTTNASGSHVRFLQDGTVKHFLGCGGGLSLGGVNDLSMRAYSNILFSTNNNSTERMRLDTSGRLLVGTSSSPSVGNGQYALAVIEGNTFNNADAGILNLQAGAAPASVGTNIGFLKFTANDGSEFAQIFCQKDGTTGSGDYPGALVFSTTADGDSSPTERVRIASGGNFIAYGVYDITTGSGANVNVASDGGLRRSTSSIKYKTDIEDLENSYADALLGCRPVWYRSTCPEDCPEHSYWGFIAEEVAEIDPRLVHWKTTEITHNENGSAVETPCDAEPEGVAYERFVPHLLNLIKRQKEQIEAMEARLSALEGA